jgi:hypothetical protein
MVPRGEEGEGKVRRSGHRGCLCRHLEAPAAMDIITQTPKTPSQ